MSEKFCYLGDMQDINSEIDWQDKKLTELAGFAEGQQRYCMLKCVV